MASIQWAKKFIRNLPPKLTLDMKYDRVSLTMLLFVHASFSLFGMERGETFIAKGHDLVKLLGTYPKFITGDSKSSGQIFLQEHQNVLQSGDPWDFLLLFFAFGTILLGILTCIYHRKLKKAQLEHNKLLKSIGEAVSKESSPQKKVPSEIMNRICEKLNEFEKENRYLDPEVSLQRLSKEMETNSSYLSKVINQYKGKTFARYLADLRIDYTIYSLKNNPKLLDYKISAIALEMGFGTSESFSRSFVRKTGQYPSHFLNQLKEKKSIGTSVRRKLKKQ